ncbi:GGDEF-domain containing protein [Actinoplanes sp. ATCC 53533]|uniref:putative bifunctional diguanylate cyclase/phosphodiesterase n=1 Tax=Actinoplanes sp. ATCC 53533 TaxID=1288362 RepID=UPI000F76F80A|nr:EAL domain-containing protein [Actinoplanes sp. ATCC 53533]RSM74185.1 GGDEF-domain containing protein [Actinoplanes sp. ATCC 53533]
MTRRARAATAAASGRRPRTWPRPDRQVAALSVAMAAAALAFNGVPLLVNGMPSVGEFGTTAWFLPLLVMFCLTEGFAIHVRVRRGGHAMSITEIPMVIALAVLNPLLVVVARTVGGTAGLAILRRQRGQKLVFNVALISLQATVAVAVYGVLAHPGGGLAGPREWLAAYAAMLAADLLAIILITAVISLHDDPSEWRRLPSAMRGLVLVLVATSIALISAIAVQANPAAAVILLVLYGVVHVGYRGYVRQSQGNAQVENLYAFTSALDSSLDTGQLMRVILGQVRDELRASNVELILPPSGTASGLQVRLSGLEQIDETPTHGPAPDAWWTPAASGIPVLLPGDLTRSDVPVDAMAAPVLIGGGVTAVLLVTESLPDIPTFTTEHLRLLQAMANHASVALANARLVDRLREEATEKEHLALHDALTGLPNRRHLYRLLDAALAPHPHTTACTAVLMMDLDRFKEINDALGHDVGDALLRAVGERLRQRLHGRGTVARLGGDEFAMLIEVTSPHDATAIGHDLVRDLERPVHLDHLTLYPRASVGIALAPEHGQDSGTLLRRADVAMYAAKQARAGVRLYRATDDQNTPQRLALIGDLRDAIDHQDTLVVFQPKVDPATGAVIGAEALSRWYHHEHGFIAPELFIPLAEHSGLIRPLTLHVLDVSLRNCAAWRRSGHPMHVAVNLSPNTLLDDTLTDVITRLLAQHDIPATALTLEITEGTLMADPDGGLVTLERLRRLGIKISIDDFGTGYSSLGRLRELPIDEIKIDRSFVQNAAHDHRDRALIRSTVQLGHALGLHVVAEGVEDEPTYTYLTQTGCDLVQGYHISRPLPEAKFTTWLRDTPPPTITRAAGHLTVAQ